MNQYGAMALRHWRSTRAAELATIADPQRFFTQLGEQVAAEIRRRSDTLTDPATLSEDFLTNLGRLNEARLTAESEVLREMIFTDPDTDTDTPTGAAPVG
jgi:hypothetical protein